MSARLAARAPVRRMALALSAVVIAGGMISFACTPDTAPVAAGGECFNASDCEQGLVCIPQQNGARQCSSDLTQVQGKPPPEAGADGEAGKTDGPVQLNDANGQDTSLPDTSMPDTSMPADAAEAG